MVPAQSLNGNPLLATTGPNCAAAALAGVMSVTNGVLGARVFPPNPTPTPSSLPLHGPFNLAGLAAAAAANGAGMCGGRALCSSSSSSTPIPKQQGAYVFCHDYLNSVCKRKVCKYIHCSKEEEDVYRKTGLLPERLKFLADNGLSALANMHTCPQEIPLCRDFQRGFCERGDLCKFQHSLIDGSGSSSNCKKGVGSTDSSAGGSQHLSNPSPCSTAAAKPLKRVNDNSSTIEHDEMSSSVRTNQTTTNSPKLAKMELEERPVSSPLNPPSFVECKEESPGGDGSGEGGCGEGHGFEEGGLQLQEENRQLKEKLSQFSRQIEELSSRNQQLHSQNSRLKQAAEEILRCRNHKPPFNGSQVLPILKSSHQSLLLPHSISGPSPGAAGLCHSSLHPAAAGSSPMAAAATPFSAAAAVAGAPPHYSNKLLQCHQMTAYNAALLSAALNPAQGTYAPAVLFTSQPFTPSWAGMYEPDSSSQMQPAAIIEEIHEHKPPNPVFSG